MDTRSRARMLASILSRPRRSRPQRTNTHARIHTSIQTSTQRESKQAHTVHPHKHTHTRTSIQTSTQTIIHAYKHHLIVRTTAILTCDEETSIWYREFHEPGFWHLSAQFSCAFVVSANLRNTCWSFYRGNCQSPQISTILRKTSTNICRQMSKSWLAKFPTQWSTRDYLLDPDVHCSYEAWLTLQHRLIVIRLFTKGIIFFGLSKK